MAFGHSQDGQIFDDRGRRKYLNTAERARFLDFVEHLAPAKRALSLVLAYTGCRLSEALALTIDHLDPDLATLTFRTLKRRKLCFRTVPIPDHLVVSLLALSPHADGRFWRMHRSAAWRLIKIAMQLCQIHGPMATPKGLRHGFGILAVLHNIPLTMIQRWMGHASIRTTAIYLDAVGPDERLLANRMW